MNAALYSWLLTIVIATQDADSVVIQHAMPSLDRCLELVNTVDVHALDKPQGWRGVSVSCVPQR